ncbi:MAG TPA: SMC-Scp complex subunit ScpB [Saprospiraceae bacterium]|nr:SMC-Scp complex subunit ScpB [Saprospiraceae bacterium]HRO08098.1 SMC-Scp complex subunit ScpB [Saprospiraceae bacterium]HRP41315.1 SMC-Scp complex subunit ScpB [Saprospiraceae bacterium]
MEIIALHLESLIFTANPSISYDDLKSSLEESLNILISDEDLSQRLDELKNKYASDSFSMEIMEVSGGFRFMTKGAYHHTIGTYLRQNTHKKLTKSALETLAIIAYKQPITKTEIESIRGVNSDYTIQKLLEKDLVEISGRSNGPGKPLLYATSQKFMDYFGLKSIRDMPVLKDFEQLQEQIGTPDSIVTEQNTE